MKIKGLLIIFLGVSVAYSCKDFNQKPDFGKGFVKYFGGESKDIASKVELTPDGGYVIVGTTSSNSNGGSDVYIVKVNREGNSEWEKRFGGIGSDSGKSIKSISDGYIIAGTLTKPNGKPTMYLLKLNAQGDSVWTRSVGVNSLGSDVQITNDGGYIFIGNTIVNGIIKIFLYKTDNNGNKIFQSDAYGYNGNNTIANTILTEDSDTLFTWVGSSQTSPLLARNRPGGNIFGYLKLEPFINESSMISYSDIIKTKAGGYVITGTCIKDGLQKAFLLKLTGDLVSNHTKDWFHFYGSSNESGSAVEETKDGGFILVGNSGSDGGEGKNIYLLKTDASGNEQWHKTFGGKRDDFGVSVKQASDGGYIIASTLTLETTPNDNQVVCLIKTDANGEITNK
jgi:hypothetical protein